MPNELTNGLTRLVARRAARYAAQEGVRRLSRRYAEGGLPEDLESAKLDLEARLEKGRERLRGLDRESLVREARRKVVKHKEDLGKRMDNWLSPAELAVYQEGELWAVRHQSKPTPAAFFVEPQAAVSWAALVASKAGGGRLNVYGPDGFYETVVVPRGLETGALDLGA